MHVGILTLEFHLGEASSLKDKRRLVKSLLSRLRSRFNVSAAEVDALESWQRAVLGVVCVANDAAYLDEVMAAVARYVETDRSLQLQGYSTEII
ncbi:MAG: DUF503 domain-containing protein [Thermoanaerobacterales bacterium]|nr:DUF503 domain-containing protein [Thermoanaerobacterales bacterium]